MEGGGGGGGGDGGGERRGAGTTARKKYKPTKVRSTGGAVRVRNSRGEVTLVPVRTRRYVAGKAPEYADDNADDSDEGGSDLLSRMRVREAAQAINPEDAAADRRLQRLQRAQPSDDNRSRRREREAVVEEDSEEEEAEKVAEVEEDSSDDEADSRPRRRSRPAAEEDESESEDEDAADARRARLRARASEIEAREEQAAADPSASTAAPGGRQREQEALARVEESEESSSEYETESDSEDEVAAMPKPMFVAKSKRATILEKKAREDEELAKAEQLKLEEQQRVEETRKLAGELVRQEEEAAEQAMLDMVIVDDDDDLDNVEEFEKWKVRELKRIKRDREERETIERERLEQERIREMTEEERQEYFVQNPKHVTNKADRGKQKLGQKYYHRGVFYMDSEEDVFKRDITQPTLDDHFDKSVLPKVMQVKKFGFQGQTKYTHLADQDTTDKDSAWSQRQFQNQRFERKRAGVRQDFDRPGNKRGRRG